jgi:hypothetical protein
MMMLPDRRLTQTKEVELFYCEKREANHRRNHQAAIPRNPSTREPADRKLPGSSIPTPNPAKIAAKERMVSGLVRS